MVIFLGMIGARRIEGQLVIRLALGCGLLQQGGEVVAAVKDETATLSSKHLQGEIADHGLIRLTDALEETLIIELAPDPLRSAERIDVVKGHSGLSHLRRKAYDHGEELVLLLIVQIDARTRKKGPAG